MPQILKAKIGNSVSEENAPLLNGVTPVLSSVNSFPLAFEEYAILFKMGRNFNM